MGMRALETRLRMTRARYLDQGAKRSGRAGWIEHQQEDTPRHVRPHDPPARVALPMRPLEEDTPATPAERKGVAPRATTPANSASA